MTRYELLDCPAEMQPAADGEWVKHEDAAAEVTRAVLRYTVRGYTAGENADAKHWRERAEKAEASIEAALAPIQALVTQWVELAREFQVREYRRLLCAKELDAALRVILKEKL